MRNPITQIQNQLRDFSWLSLFHAGLLVLAFYILRNFVVSFIPDYFTNPQETLSVTGSPFLEVFRHAFPQLVLVLLTAPFVIFYKALRWKQLEEAVPFRYIIFFSALLLAWLLSFSEYNFYLDQDFLFDRLMIVLFAFLIFFHPVFVPVFLAFALSFQAQQSMPFGWIYPHLSKVFFDFMLLFVGFALLSAGLKIRANTFMVVLLCLHLANYFYSGLGKLALSPHGFDWIFLDEIRILPGNAHLRGWLMEYPGLFYQLRSIAENFGSFILAFILFAELAVIFFFTGRKTAVLLLVSLNIMHIGIAVMVGIFFWPWILLNAFLVFFLLFFLRPPVDFFGLHSSLIAVPVLAFSGFFFSPSRLSWLESRMQWYFELEVEDDEGNRFFLEKKDLNPFALSFEHDIFTFIYNGKLIGYNGYSTLDAEEMYALRNASPDDIPGLREKYGRNHFIPAAVPVCDDFVRRYFALRNSRGESKVFLKWMMPPTQLYMFRNPGRKFQFQRPVKLFRMYLKEYFFYQGIYVPVTDAVFREIRI